MWINYINTNYVKINILVPQLRKVQIQKQKHFFLLNYHSFKILTWLIKLIKSFSFSVPRGFPAGLLFSPLPASWLEISNIALLKTTSLGQVLGFLCQNLQKKELYLWKATTESLFPSKMFGREEGGGEERVNQVKQFIA